jgi:hypothetical protein
MRRPSYSNHYFTNLITKEKEQLNNFEIKGYREK